MNLTQGYQFLRLIQVLHDATADRERPEKVRENTNRSLLAAITGAHSSLVATGDPDAAVVSAWIRSPRDGQVRLLVGGRPEFPPATGRPDDGALAPQRAILFPAGATASDLPSEEVADLLAEFPYWIPCSGRSDALWATEEPKAPKAPPRGAFDRHVAHLGQPFAWMAIANPLRPPELQDELEALVGEILPLSRGEVSETKRVGLERKQTRHRELSRSQLGGSWRIRILAGGIRASDAATVAAVLCAAIDLDGLPYVLVPGPRAESLTIALQTDIRDTDGNQTPFTASSELLVALSRPPARELPGVRLAQPHTFDVTPEHDGSATAPGLHLGGVLDESMATVADLTLPAESLNRHTFVCGATGAGKSHTVRYLLEQASRAGIPWLVIEPAKAEYALTTARLAEIGQQVFVLRPGRHDQPPAGLNPMQPAAGFPLQTHVDLLRALFLASFEPFEPFPQILASALTRCYEECGWDLILSEPNYPGHSPRYPDLADLQRVAEATVKQIGYGPEVASNVRGFIKVRLASLRLGTTGSFFSSGHPLDFSKLRARNVVLEIEDVGDDTDKAFLMGAILMRLVEELRVASHAGTLPPGLSHLTVVEEAHRLLRRPTQGASGTAAHAVETFAALLAEVRAYGEGLVIAEQIPSKLIPDVIKNTAVKIVHRLPAADDRESVGATMNLDQPQSRYLVTLRRGEGAAFADGMDRPVLVKVPPIQAGPKLPSGSLSELIGRRSVTCGRECVSEPCTLRQMRAAQHLLQTEGWLTLWAELTILAHLANHPTPVPNPANIAGLRARSTPSRLTDCAVSHAVDDALAVRSGSLLPATNPANLAEHACTVMRRVLNGADPGCDTDARQFVCPPFVWELVRNALVADIGDPEDKQHDPGPHPHTSQWQRLYGRMIPGQTRAEQLTVVNSWPDSDIADPTRRDAVVYGTRRPSTIESVIDIEQEGWAKRLEAALAQFGTCSWPLLYIYPPSEHASEWGPP